MKWLVFLLLVSVAHADPYAETRYCGPPKRDAAGKIIRSASVIAAFRKIHPCPSTGVFTSACPGWSINHSCPLACGCCDSVANMEWMRNDVKAIVDRYERKIWASNPPQPDTGACVNQVMP